jgi:hypothetical protein
MLGSSEKSGNKKGHHAAARFAETREEAPLAQTPVYAPILTNDTAAVNGSRKHKAESVLGEGIAQGLLILAAISTGPGASRSAEQIHG